MDDPNDAARRNKEIAEQLIHYMRTLLFICAPYISIRDHTRFEEIIQFAESHLTLPEETPDANR